MTLLLDTQSFVWWVQSDPRLSAPARAAIADSAAPLHVSLATAWVIAIKVGKGKWPAAEPLLANFETILAEEAFELLPITVSDVRAAGLMQVPHRDPFDRLIVAQAALRNLRLVTSDAKLADLGVEVVW